MKITFHSWLKNTLGSDEEELTLPQGIETVADLAAYLATKHEAAASIFETAHALRYVIDRQYVEPEHELGNASAIEIYPPVTGG